MNFKFIKKPLWAILPNRWKRRKRNFLAALIFHQASPSFKDLPHLKYTWAQLTKLEKQLLYLKKNFNLVSLYDGIRQLENNALSGHCAAISFDDGCISVEKYIYPLLKKYNIPATFFVNSAYLDNEKISLERMLSQLQFSNRKNEASINGIYTELRNTSDPETYDILFKKIIELYGKSKPKEPLYVSRDFLGNLDENLFTIGLHGHEHHRFSMMPYNWQFADIETNIAHLSQYKSYKPIFAIPYGRPNDWDVNLIKICLDKELYIVGANGGVNLTKNVIYSRIPADSKNLKKLF